MTAVPDHRPGMVTLSCRCGTVLELPPAAAAAARPHFDRIHAGHAPADTSPKAFVPAAGYARRS